MPKPLIDLCTFSVLRHVETYNKIVLPEELTVRLLALLIEAKKLNENTLLPFLHSSLRNLNLRFLSNSTLTHPSTALGGGGSKRRAVT
jgi:hypothetical protein